MKVLRLFLMTLGLGLICSGCSVNPVTGENQFLLVSPAQEKKMGEEYSKQVEKELGQSVKDVELQNYINSVGQKVARVSHTPDESFSYKAIDSNTVNAFALPGGYIYITTGLLKELKTESQMASVLAHETAHVTARHIAKQITQNYISTIIVSGVSYVSPVAGDVSGIVANLQKMSFSRADEKQADEVGLGYLVKAGYTPNGMVETMEILQRQSGSRTIEFFSTHPSPENRIGLLKEHIINNHYAISGKIGKEIYAVSVTERLRLIKPQKQEQSPK